MEDVQMTFLMVRHNIEVAHRLYELEGKCENIHGHSMWVELKLFGHVNSKGVLEGLSFGEIKKQFRGFLDGTFDHHLLLHEKDPWAGLLEKVSDLDGYPAQLPGLMAMPGDPTTENLAKWIADWAVDTFHLPCDVLVHETGVNASGISVKPKNGDKQ
jgi:6-pyruvoyl-tetrahydropterin synthase